MSFPRAWALAAVAVLVGLPQPALAQSTDSYFEFLQARRLEADGVGWPEGKSGSDWIVMARRPQDIAPLITGHGWRPLAVSDEGLARA